MPKTDVTSVDEYIALRPKAVRAILELVRSTIAKALPDAVEVIAYKMPTFNLRGSTVLHFAAWKQHYSLYPANERVLATFGNELAAYEVVKSTIHFPFSKPVPVKLITRIAQFRAEEIAERTKGKPATKER